jgi:hypothetical protein
MPDADADQRIACALINAYRKIEVVYKAAVEKCGAQMVILRDKEN